jgi:aryl-alcohol dehydrogenase-like predicted oxidoreductase
MLFCANRLAIGTANWGKEYNGVKVSEPEQEKILKFCRQVGIDMLDIATAYEWTAYWPLSHFKKVIKVGKWDTIDDTEKIAAKHPYCLMAHDGYYVNEVCECAGRHGILAGESVYPDGAELNGSIYDVRTKIVQLPYSLFDRRYEYILPVFKEQGKEVHVRSVFLRGKILEKATPHECISFCLMNPNVDRVIMGVDSLAQLESNLEGLMNMDALKVTDEKVLDPRQWQDYGQN